MTAPSGVVTSPDAQNYFSSYHTTKFEYNSETCRSSGTVDGCYQILTSRRVEKVLRKCYFVDLKIIKIKAQASRVEFLRLNNSQYINLSIYLIYNFPKLSL